MREAGEELFDDGGSPRGAARRRRAGSRSPRPRGGPLAEVVLPRARRCSSTCATCGSCPAAALRNVLYHVASYLGRTDVPLEGFRPQAGRDRRPALRRAGRGGPPARCAGELAPNMAFLWLTHARALLALAADRRDRLGAEPRARRSPAIAPRARLSACADQVRSRAAVALVCPRTRRRGGLELLFIRRAEHPQRPLVGPHGFPGRPRRARRRRPGGDRRARDRARRSGLDLARRRRAARGPRRGARAWRARGRPVDLVIAPFVFRLRGRSTAERRAHEVVSLHWLSLERSWRPRHAPTLRVPATRRPELAAALPARRRPRDLGPDLPDVREPGAASVAGARRGGTPVRAVEPVGDYPSS